MPTRRESASGFERQNAFSPVTLRHPPPAVAKLVRIYRVLGCCLVFRCFTWLGLSIGRGQVNEQWTDVEGTAAKPAKYQIPRYR